MDLTTAELVQRLRTGPDAAVFAAAPRSIAPLVPVIDVHFAYDNSTPRWFSIVSTIGTPPDITAQELASRCSFRQTTRPQRAGTPSVVAADDRIATARRWQCSKLGGLRSKPRSGRSAVRIHGFSPPRWRSVDRGPADLRRGHSVSVVRRRRWASSSVRSWSGDQAARRAARRISAWDVGVRPSIGWSRSRFVGNG
jgi:hypothetical protein